MTSLPQYKEETAPLCPFQLINKCRSSKITEDHFTEHEAIELDGYRLTNSIDLQSPIRQEGLFVKIATKKYVYLFIGSGSSIDILIIDLEPGAVRGKAIITFTNGTKEIIKHLDIADREHYYGLKFALNIQIHALLETFGIGTINVNVTFPKLEPNTNSSSTSETMMEKLKGAANTLSMNERIIKNLQCPGCKNTMRPPIFQCVVGHSICHKCRPKLKECPVCKASIGDTRAFTLENMCAEFTYLCLNREYGCTVGLDLKHIEAHEIICEFKPYICPLCSKPGACNNLKSHLTSIHRTKFFNKKTIQTSFNRIVTNIDRKSYICLEFMDKLHLIQISVGLLDYEFTTIAIGKQQEPYFYQIVFKNAKNTKRNMSRTEKSDRKIILSRKHVDCVDKFDSILLACKILL